MTKTLRKIVCIGDIHGRDDWNKIVDDNQDADLFVFLGDYVSTHDRKGITDEIQLNNLMDILLFKEENPERVILLRGNHDMQHLNYYWAECCAYFRGVAQEMSKPEIKDRYLRDTQWVYVMGDIIFSHAGITDRWFHDSGCETVEDINNLEPSELFGFRPCKLSDYYGISKTQGPTWVRPQTLLDYALPHYTQVVGHTTLKHIVNFTDVCREDAKNNPDSPWKVPDDAIDIWVCDCDLKEYLVIEGDKFTVKTV